MLLSNLCRHFHNQQRVLLFNYLQFKLINDNLNDNSILKL